MNCKTFWVFICSSAFCGVSLLAQTVAQPISDQQFLKMVAEADMTSAHLGKMAEDQAATDSVKDFGKTLVQDHTSDYTKLSAVASKVGETVPNGIDADRDKTISRLEHLKGKAFDRQFLRDEVRSQKELLTAFKREAEHGQNTDVKAYANQMLPTIETHIHKAEDLETPAKHST